MNIFLSFSFFFTKSLLPCDNVANKSISTIIMVYLVDQKKNPLLVMPLKSYQISNRPGTPFTNMEL